MKTFIVEIHKYPVEIKVVAESKDEALSKAKDIFDEMSGGASIYSSEVTEDIE